ncbi:MAG TPA: hypothetical protein VID48_13530, partial [Solirubrobacteraceae bacterium]
ALSALLITACLNNGGSATSRSSVPVSSRLLQEMGQLWTADSTVSGYGEVFNLEAEPSLYQTAWSIRLATKYHVAVPAIDTTKLSTWLQKLVDEGKGVQGLPALETFRLACQALADLGQTPAKDAAASIASLRGPGGLYRFDAGQPESWGATEAAVDAMRAAGVSIPPDLTGMIRLHVRATTADPNLSPDDWLQLLLPQWQLADELLPSTERDTLKAALIAELGRVIRSIASIPPEGVLVFVEANLVQIATANGLPLRFPADSFAPLETSDGMLIAIPQQNLQPDPKTTFYAGVAGRSEPDGLAQYLQRTAGPQGWRLDVTSPDPQSSFYAVSIVRALGGHVPTDALLTASRTWLHDDLVAFEKSLDSALLKQAYFALELSLALGVNPPGSSEPALQQVQPALAGLKSEAALWGALLVSRSGLPASPALVEAAHQAALHLDTGGTSAVSLAWTVSHALGWQDAETSVQAMHSPWPLGGVYAARAGIPTADIESTATGFEINGGTRQEMSAAARKFVDQAGYWLLPPTIRDGNVVDLQTLYLGLWLSGSMPATKVPII